ncbi:hypothetical protein [Novosphingobium sp. MMS21-SN21R]|uniref:hypothetical protein n=1 Tax=Novosphingobium sp. MMS21-SN21R TaxID=2969298 RepID=UPI002886863D|nr:hypothetical protein [Novosphingobium sp. MMS21-SN21R]MDT0507448.1 hypothetical protein [Novosphingobium sp. MMS21-SN21R]
MARSDARHPGKVHDPDDPGATVGITEEGLRFRDIAEDIVQKLHSFRTEEVKSREIISQMTRIVSALKGDLSKSPPLNCAVQRRSQIELFTELVSTFTTDLPAEVLDGIYRPMKTFYCNYEREKALELRRKTVGKRKRTPLE